MPGPKDGAVPPRREGGAAPVENLQGQATDPESGKRPDAPPTSRLSRLARLATLGTRAIPAATEVVRRAMGSQRTADEERAAAERALQSARNTADAMLKTLGEMKGLPLKLGQMASYVDGLAPPGYEEQFHAVLRKLQQKAPPLSSEAAERVIRSELGSPPSDVFAEWETEPFAAASIGQVHRATTRSGDRVAVKVQYPGIDVAIDNDLKSLSLLESMVAPMGRRYHTKETLEEVRSVFLAEVDYGNEATNTDLFRKMHAGDPNVLIPEVFHSLSTKRVLTTSLMGGVDYATFCDTASEEERNAAGRTIWTFMFRSLYRYGVLYADPHPGNYRFLGGGRVAFLDFGCVKVLPPPLVDGMKRYVVAAQEGRWGDFETICTEVLGLDPSDTEAFRLYIDYAKFLLEPMASEEPYRFTREAARESVQFLIRGGRKLVFKSPDRPPEMPKPIHMPTDFTFVNRLQWGLMSILAGLGAEADWRAMTIPWVQTPVESIGTTATA